MLLGHWGLRSFGSASCWLILELTYQASERLSGVTGLFGDMGKVAFEVPALDKLLDGGVERGAITLLYGEAGSGKTNLCLQLSRNVVLAGQKVLFIDTEGVSMERLQQISGDRFEQVTASFLVSVAHNFEEQEKAVDKASRLAESEVDVGLIVVDSMTLHYRLTSRDEERSGRRSLAPQLAKLLRIARARDIPVVVTSQVYMDVARGTIEALGGHPLHHTAKLIVKLEKAGVGQRRATLMKHRHMPEGETAAFRLTAKGVE